MHVFVILAPSFAVAPPGPRKAFMTEQRQPAECGPRAKAAPPMTKTQQGKHDTTCPGCNLRAPSKPKAWTFASAECHACWRERTWIREQDHVGNLQTKVEQKLNMGSTIKRNRCSETRSQFGNGIRSRFGNGFRSQNGNANGFPHSWGSSGNPSAPQLNARSGHAWRSQNGNVFLYDFAIVGRLFHNLCGGI